jgi:hypothetical protein
MDIAFYDPLLPNGAELAFGFKRARTLEELLSTADVITIHAPLTEETRGLIDRKAIAAMKKGAIVINTARGPICDTAALLEGLKSGKLGAVGHDRRSAGCRVAGERTVAARTHSADSACCVLQPRFARRLETQGDRDCVLLPARWKARELRECGVSEEAAVNKAVSRQQSADSLHVDCLGSDGIVRGMRSSGVSRANTQRSLIIPSTSRARDFE